MRLLRKRRNLGSLIVVTEHWAEVRKVARFEEGEVVDDQGVKYTRPMLRGVRLPSGEKCLIALMDTVAFQRLEELASEMSNVIFHEALKVETSAHRIIQWVVMGAMIVIGFMMLVQVTSLRAAVSSDIADVNAKLMQIMSVVTQPTRLDVP